MKKLLIGLVTFFFMCGMACAASNVTFEWDANSETDLAGYRLYQSTVSGTYDTFEVEIPAGTETITLEGIPDGTYFWVVTAYDTDDNESGYSNEVTANLDTLAPSTPQTVTITIIIKVH